MSHVEFKKQPRLFVFILLSLGPMSHVNFKKWPYRHVEFKGERPQV